MNSEYEQKIKQLTKQLEMYKLQYEKVKKDMNTLCNIIDNYTERD